MNMFIKAVFTSEILTNSSSLSATADLVNVTLTMFRKKILLFGLSMFLVLVIPILCFFDGFRFVPGSTSKDTDVSLQVSRRFVPTTPNSSFLYNNIVTSLISALILLLEMYAV